MSRHGSAAADSCNAPLYRFVFRGRLSFTTVFLLCATFVLSGVHATFASEPEQTASTIESVGEVEDFREPVIAEVVEEDAYESDIESMQQSVQASDAPVAEEADTPPINTESEPVSVPEDSPSGILEPLLPESVSEQTDASSTLSQIATTSEQVTDFAEEVVNVGSTETTPELETVTEEIATSSSATSSPLHVDTVTNADNYYQFSREDCVRVADGSFYCGETKNEQENAVEDGLLAAPDSEGDLEIFLRFDGVETQITNNTVDDAAPYYDSRSNTIVWHRLIHDRYQIVSYDLEKVEEKQLTHGNGNSMEPSRYGKLTAWQTWVENNWEIVLFDGEEQHIITKSPQHDVAPLVYESYVLWNTTAATGEQQIAMYDLERDDTTLINDEDGASVRNPRMVLVYETANEHGDIMTKGFDLASRTVVPLAATPREVPSEIPESDQTGETRALINNKSSVKESELLDPAPEPVGTSTPNTIGTSTATTTKPTESNAGATLIVATSTAEAVIEDVVVAPYDPATTSVTIVDPSVLLEDIVVPPFSATSSN